MSKKPTLNQLAPDFEAKPVFGKRLLLQKEAQTRPLVLVFVPGLASPVARNHLASLQSRVADFDLAGVGLYALTPSTLVSAQDFVPRHHLLFPLIADKDRPASIIDTQSQALNTRLRQLAEMLDNDGLDLNQPLSLGDCGFPITFTWMDKLASVMGLQLEFPDTVIVYRQHLEQIPAVAAELEDYTTKLDTWLSDK